MAGFLLFKESQDGHKVLRDKRKRRQADETVGIRDDQILELNLPLDPYADCFFDAANSKEMIAAIAKSDSPLAKTLLGLFAKLDDRGGVILFLGD